MDYFDICIAAVISGLVVWCVIEAVRTTRYTWKKRRKKGGKHDR